MKTDEAVRLCKHRGAACIAIWEPRYHDNRVLIACRKVRDHNIIKFTKAPSMQGLWYVSGKNIRKYPKASNGTIACFSVPLEELKPFEWQRCCHDF